MEVHLSRSTLRFLFGPTRNRMGAGYIGLIKKINIYRGTCTTKRVLFHLFCEFINLVYSVFKKQSLVVDIIFLHVYIIIILFLVSCILTNIFFTPVSSVKTKGVGSFATFSP